MLEQEKVVVTGIGLVTPVGIGTTNAWQSILACKNGFGTVQSFDTSKYRVHVGAEINDFNFADHCPELAKNYYGRTTQLAIVGAKLALENAGLQNSDLTDLRKGVAMGTTSGEPNQVERFNNHRIAEQWDQLGAEYMDTYPCHSIPSNVANTFGFHDLAPIMLPAACAAGNYAIAHATDCIRRNEADMILAGGADSFSRITYTGFARLIAIAPEICRPFDKERKGMIPGEGSGFLVLESLTSARKRGANIIAEIAGYGTSCDAHHMTGSHPKGDGAIRAMKRALKDSKLTTSDVSYICAHGTGTKSNDVNETIGIKNLFGDNAKDVAISSIKSMLGHTMGAASAIEAGICALAIKNNILPPTANYETPDPACDLDYIPNAPREGKVSVAMNNAYAFGGANASVILKEFNN